MLTRKEADAAAASLVEAEQSRRQIGLLSTRHEGMTIDDAYAVQDAFNRLKTDGGDRQTGWKIGLTSRAMQAALQIDTPDSGVLFDSMAFDDGATVPKGRFIQPRIEAELAFVLHSELSGPDVTVLDVLRATEVVMPVLEILDTRIERVCSKTGRMRNVCDTIADNAANAGYVLGGSAVSPDGMDLRLVHAIVMRNGLVEETGLAAGVLNHPARGIAWLARRLSTLGQAIQPGQVLLSGSFIRPIETAPGTTITADFGELGTLSCFFE